MEQLGRAHARSLFTQVSAHTAGSDTRAQPQLVFVCHCLQVLDVSVFPYFGCLFVFFVKVTGTSPDNSVVYMFGGQFKFSPIYYTSLCQWSPRWHFRIHVTVLEFYGGREFHLVPIKSKPTVYRMCGVIEVFERLGSLIRLQTATLAPCFQPK